MVERTTHSAAIEGLLSEEDRDLLALRTQSLVYRNLMLTLLEHARETTGWTKTHLAKEAGLDPSSVRRLLTAETANPTTDYVFRLLAAMGVGLEATLPDGERVPVIPHASFELSRAATKTPGTYQDAIASWDPSVKPRGSGRPAAKQRVG